MGAIGAILAGAADPRVAAVVATSAPADPYRLTRQTFRLARLPIPDPIAYPLAWLTTRVYLRPRGHVVADISATTAHRPLRRAGPAHPRRRRRRSCPSATWPGWSRRPGGARRRPVAAEVETLVVPGRPALVAVRGRRPTGGSWPVPAPALGGPLEPAEAAATSPRRRTPTRIPDGEAPFAAVEDDARRLPDARPGRAPRRHARAAAPSRATRPSRPRPRAWSHDADPEAPRPGLARDQRASGSSGGSPTDRSSRPTSSGSSTPAGEPAAAKNSSAGRSSSAATGITCASCRRSGRGPATSPARPSAIALRDARSARRLDPRGDGRRCRSCSTSGRPPRT